MGINEVCEREKRAKRKKWREAKKAARAKVSRARESLSTPPATPESQSEPEPGPSRLEQVYRKCTRHMEHNTQL